MNKTTQPSLDTLDRQWFVVDAADQTLGRLASEVAQVLRVPLVPRVHLVLREQ